VVDVPIHDQRAADAKFLLSMPRPMAILLKTQKPIPVSMVA